MHREHNADSRTPQNTLEDDVSFLALVHNHAVHLRRYCRRFAHSDEECADLQQEVWLRAWEKRTQFEGRGSVAGWLFRLARTVCVRHASQRGLITSGSDLDSFEAPPDADPVAATKLQELEDNLLSLIMSLPKRRRRVVIARLRAGMSTEETARSMNCTSGTVKATLHQAIASLRSSAISSGLMESDYSDWRLQRAE